MNSSLTRPSTLQRTLLALFASLLAAISPSAQVQDAQSFLQTAIEEANRESKFPGLAAALIENGQLVASVVSGVRRSDGEAAIRLDDKFHIGSVTKSFTATMIGKLIEEGKMEWEMTIGESLPDIEVGEAYADCTLRELLQHRAGLPAFTQRTPAEAIILNGFKGNGTEVRRQFAALAMQSEGTKRGGFVYSNAGYSVAGLMAEEASGESWRQLIQTRIFKPLKLRQAGFGWPATSADAEQPFGHWGVPGGPFQVVGIDEYDLGSYISPAGNVHCSIEDLALYALNHMQGLQGLDGILKAETFEELHTPSSLGGPRPYACGWLVANRGRENESHAHNGSAGSFYAMVELVPRQDRALVFLINAADFRESAWSKLKAAAVERFEEMLGDD